ncbi:MAG: cold-shock protein [Planctomycetota bacterium]|jgi:CspA family cold shock protein
MRAQVKWFDNRRGWGFLVLEDGREVFVHHRHLKGRGFRTLRAGEAVACEVATGEHGLHATDVRRPE